MGKGGRLCTGAFNIRIDVTEDFSRLGNQQRHAMERAMIFDGGMKRPTEREQKEFDSRFSPEVCATCMKCPHRETVSHMSENYRDMKTELIVRTSCGAVGEDGRQRRVDPLCNDGYNTVTHQWHDLKAPENHRAEPFDPKFQNSQTLGERNREIHERTMKAISSREPWAIGRSPDEVRDLIIHEDNEEFESLKGLGRETWNRMTGLSPTEQFNFNHEFMYDSKAPERKKADVKPSPWNPDMPTATDAGSW